MALIGHEVLASYCCALSFWEKHVPLGFRELTIGERIIVLAPTSSTLADNPRKAMMSTYFTGYFESLRPEGQDTAMLKPAMMSCCEGLCLCVEGLPSCEELRIAGLNSSDCVAAPLQYSYPFKRMTLLDSLLSIPQGSMVLLGSACCPLLTIYRFLDFGDQKKSMKFQAISDGVDIEFALWHFTCGEEANGALNLIFLGETFNDMEAESPVFSNLPAYFPARLLGLGYMIERATTNASDEGSTCSNPSSAVANVDIDVKSPWILKVSMALGNCVVASTQKIAENLKVCRDHTLFSGTRDLQTLLPNQVTSRQKGFQKSYLLYRDRLCMAAINSESFCETLRIVEDLLRISLTPIMLLTHILRHLFTKIGPISDDMVGDTSKKLEVDGKNRDEIVSYEMSCEILGVQFFDPLVVFINDAASIFLEYMCTFNLARQTTWTQRRLWYTKCITLFKVKDAGLCVLRVLGENPSEKGLCRLKTSLMSLLSSIEVVLKRQQEDVQLIATNYGRILTGDILRQDWTATSPYRRGKKVSPGVITIASFLWELVYDCLEFLTNTPFLLDSGHNATLQFLALSIHGAVQNLASTALDVFSPSRLRLSQLSCDISTTVLHFVSVLYYLDEKLAHSSSDIDGDTYNQFNKSRGYWLQKARVGFIWGKCYPEPFGCGGEGRLQSCLNKKIISCHWPSELCVLLLKYIVYVFLKTSPVGEILEILKDECSFGRDYSHTSADISVRSNLSSFDILKELVLSALSKTDEAEEKANLNKNSCTANFFHIFRDFRFLTRDCSNAVATAGICILGYKLWALDNMTTVVLPNVKLNIFWLCNVLSGRYEMLDEENTGFPILTEDEVNLRRELFILIRNIRSGPTHTLISPG